MWCVDEWVGFVEEWFCECCCFGDLGCDDG